MKASTVPALSMTTSSAIWTQIIGIELAERETALPGGQESATTGQRRPSMGDDIAGTGG